MSNSTPITVVGNLTADPELRYTQAGKAVANFTVASTPRRFDPQTGQWVDGEPMFLPCNLWGQPGENAAESLAKGMRVVVTGSLVSRSFQTQAGENRRVFEVKVDEVGPSLRYATAQVTRNPQQGQGQWQGQQQPQQPQQQAQQPQQPQQQAFAPQQDEPPF